MVKTKNLTQTFFETLIADRCSNVQSLSAELICWLLNDGIIN
jgi:hypothetical protein